MLATTLNPGDVATARRWAGFFRERGFNPLPSRPDAKRPMIRFAGFWATPYPAAEFERFETTNIQLVLGRPWGLIAVDLDGPEARQRWATMGRVPRTWVTHSGGDGLHLWFTVPKQGPYITKRVVWRGEGKHSLIEILGDKSLLMAPPSIHPTTGERYRFLSRAESPAGLPMPAPAPAWILALPGERIAPALAPLPAASQRTAPRLTRHETGGGRAGRTYRRDEVLAAIPDVPALVQSWGVRLTGRPNANGWWPCHAIDREDRNPSAAIHVRSGYYSDLGSGRRLSLLDLGVHLGIGDDWREVLNHLGDTYCARCA